MNYYLEVLKKYTEFEGRASRQEYWMFTLVNVLINIILWVIGSALALALRPLGIIIEGITFLYMLAVLLPSLAVSIRRLHDAGFSGWWFFIVFIPFGVIVLFIFTLLPSKEGDNQYGPHPHGVSGTTPAAAPVTSAVPAPTSAPEA